MKNPIKMDDLGGPPLFLETPIGGNSPPASVTEPSQEQEENALFEVGTVVYISLK